MVIKSPLLFLGKIGTGEVVALADELHQTRKSIKYDIDNLRREMDTVNRDIYNMSKTGGTLHSIHESAFEHELRNKTKGLKTVR